MFRFRLQRVLDLRERRERDAAAALTRAHDAADAARREAQALAAARAELAAELAPAGVPVGALHNVAFLLDRLDERAAVAGAAARAAEARVGEHEGALRAAYRERRTLDRLRERHEDAWRQQVAAADRQQMDDLALVRFARATA